MSATSDEITLYPHGIRLLVISLALALTILCTSLDETIVATAIPVISDHFHALKDVSWYGSAYLLTAASFQLLFGRLYGMFPIKWVFISALTIFELGSLICALAPSSFALIFGRAIGGLGCAGMVSGAFIIIAHSVPLRLRGTFTGIIGMTYGIGASAGPLLGGVFTTRLSWRWCFWINLPCGALTVLAMLFALKTPSKPSTTERKKFDWIGTVTSISGTVCLLLALQWGGSVYAWNNARIIVLLVLFVLLLVVFIATQIQQKEDATIPPRIIKQRSIALSALYGFVLGAAFDNVQYYLPEWFQAVKGVSAEKSGIMIIPFILGYNVFSLIVGVGTSICGYYTPFMLSGSIILAIASGLLTTLTPGISHAKWIAYLFLFGVGQGMGAQQTFLAAQTVLQDSLEDVAIGTSLMVFSQLLGSTISVTLCQSIFNSFLLSGLKKDIPNIDPSVVLNTGATDIGSLTDKNNLPVVKAVFNYAVTRTFFVAVAMACFSFFLALGIEWRSVKDLEKSPDIEEIPTGKTNEKALETSGSVTL